MTAGAPAGLDEIYALIRQSALKIDRFSLRSRRISVFSAFKKVTKRRGRRDTPRTAEKSFNKTPPTVENISTDPPAAVGGIGNYYLFVVTVKTWMNETLSATFLLVEDRL